MEHDVQLISALRAMLVNIQTAQAALHNIANKNIEKSHELNDLWLALDKAELVIRRIIQ